MTDYLDPDPPVGRRLRNDPYAEGDSTSPAEPYDEPTDDLYEGREMPDFVPDRLRRAIDSRRDWWTSVDTLAMAIIGLQLFALFIETVGGSLYLDDLRAQAYALNQPFWSFIMGSNGTHFAPLPRVLDWVQSRAFPLDHAPAVVVTLVIRLLFAVLFWRILRRLFGARMTTLLPLVLLVVTPAMLPASLWYRQSITIVACTVGMLWALDAHLRWLVERKRSALVEIALATAVSVGCYEKGAAIPIVLAGATIALFARGRRRSRRPDLVPIRSRALASLLVSGIVVGGFLLIYRSGPYDQGPGSGALPSVFDVLHLAWDTSTRDIIPLLLGGPYHWTFVDQYAGTSHLGTTTVAITVVITAIALVLALLRRPSPVVRALVLLLAWLIPSVAIVAVGRFNLLELILADATRLWVDLVPAFILAGALAVLPWEIGACRSVGRTRPSVSLIGSAAAESSDSTGTGESGPVGGGARVRDRSRRREQPSELTIPAIAGGLVILVIAAGSAVSTVAYISKWWDNPTGAWVSNMKTSVSAAEPYARVLATPLPEAVMPSWVSAKLPTSAPLLQLIRSDLRFNDGDGPARALNPSGALSPIVQGPIANSAPAAFCVKKIPVGNKTGTGVPLVAPAVYVSGAQIEVGVLLKEVTPVKVEVRTADNQRLTPQSFSNEPLSDGAHVLHFPAPLGKTITGVYVTTNATKDGCITNVRVWAPVTNP